MRLIRLLAQFSTSFALIACLPDVPENPDYQQHVQPIFDAHCTSACHEGTNPSESLALSGNAYDKLVDVSSVQLPSMPLVSPNQPDNSYLLHKLYDTQELVGGEGLTMPIGTDLKDAEIELIERWILQGALEFSPPS